LVPTSEGRRMDGIRLRSGQRMGGSSGLARGSDVYTRHHHGDHRVLFATLGDEKFGWALGRACPMSLSVQGS